MVTVGSCNNQVELAELCRLHEACRGKYNSTVFDTRCVVFCIQESESVNGENGDIINDNDREDDNDNEQNDQPPTWFKSHTHKTQLLQYHSSSYHAALNADIQDFIKSLFWILESKRVEATRDTSDKIPLLCAPFERKDFVGLDMESRNNRKRVLGRLKKHLGDLSLQAGLLAEAWNYYNVAVDVLRPANDWLWLAASLEGLCAVSVCLQEQSRAGINLGSRGLSDHEMVEKYREAVIHYGKYKHAGIIETEASIKAVMVLISQGNFLLAAEFLQNIVFINLQMNDAEKIARFLALSDLYQQIGFKRKSAFYKRVAAMRCVAPQNPNHDWATCYRLMLAAVPGYEIRLTAAEAPDKGWPALQVQLLQELVGTSRKMGANTASTRHMTFLLQHMFSVLSESERKDFSGQLSILASTAGSSNEPLSLEALSLELPSIPLQCLPSVTKFSPQLLPPHLVPHSRKSSQSAASGPFLFTPITNFGGGSARSSGRAKQQPVSWVAGEVGSVLVEVTNPLAVDLRVPRVSLISEGVSIQAEPVNLRLDPVAQSGPSNVSLEVTPLEAGQLTVLGYRHSALGINSECLLESLDLPQSSHTITVIPPLPLVTMAMEQRLGGSWVPVLASPVHLYSGETVQFRLTVNNVGKMPVGELKVDCVNVEPAHGSTAPVIRVIDGDIASSLPLAPGDEMVVMVEMTGVVDTLTTMASLKQEEDNLSSASDSRWNFSLPTSSLRSGFTTPAPTTTGHPSLMSCASVGSGSSSAPGPLTSLHTINMRLEYCGEGDPIHCRKCVHTVSLVQIPSLIVTRWDVLPGDTQHNCFLVLDLVNRTHTEMELRYTERKTLLIEPGDMCRVPVPVLKCSFSDSLEWAGGAGVVEYLASCVSLAWSIVTQDSVSGEELTR